MKEIPGRSARGIPFLLFPGDVVKRELQADVVA
jgi:hypothetical protein